MNNKKLIIGIVLFVAILFGLSRLPLTEYLNTMIEWFRGFGVWAPVIYFVFFSLTSSWLFPVFMLSIAAGILFGPWVGWIVVSLGNLASCLGMFLLSRFSAREWFAEKFANHDKVQGLIRAIEEEGWKVLAMLRAVPIVHMIVLNVTCGLSKMKVREYLWGTWLGMSAMLLLYTYMGSVTGTVISSPGDFEFGGAQTWAVGIFIVVVLIVFSVYMKKVLRKHLSGKVSMA